MNAGANCGINVIYSGTIAAAIEAAFLGIPAIAVSLHIGDGDPAFDIAAAHARRVIERILDPAGGGLQPHECLSINIPRTEKGPGGGGARIDRMPPVRVCPMNIHPVVDSYERRVSPQGDVYYWAASSGLDFRQADPDTDVDRLIARREITVTPLRYDLSRHDALDRWRSRLSD
jgi:5'-nucleotidase